MEDRNRIRVWDKKKKRYYEIFTNHVLFDTFGKEITVEHCTGREDKNSKLMHDGDIINTKYGRAEVFWCKHSLSWKYEFDIDCDLLANAEDVEIIGNVNENPELLNKGDNNGKDNSRL